MRTDATIIADIARISGVLRPFSPIASARLPLPAMDLPREILLMRRSPQIHPSAIPIIHPDRFMLALILRGEGTAVINKVAFHLHPRQALLVFPHQFHHFTGLDKHDFLWLFCSFRMACARDIIGLKNNPAPIKPEMWPLVQALVRDYCDPDRMRPRLLGRIAVSLWSLLLALSDCMSLNTVKTAAPPEHPVRDLEFLEKLQTFLVDHLRDQISAEQVAGHLGVSRRCLYQRFQSLMGMGLNKYLQRLRMQQAAGLISTTDLTLSQVADQVGYTSVFSFSRAFKRALRLAPSAYRAAHGRK